MTGNHIVKQSLLKVFQRGCYQFLVMKDSFSAFSLSLNFFLFFIFRLSVPVHCILSSQFHFSILYRPIELETGKVLVYTPIWHPGSEIYAFPGICYVNDPENKQNHTTTKSILNIV